MGSLNRDINGIMFLCPDLAIVSIFLKILHLPSLIITPSQVKVKGVKGICDQEYMEIFGGC